MKVLFLSLTDFTDFSERGIYSDLLSEFIKKGDEVFCISPVERRKNQGTYLIERENGKILKLKIGNIQKTNLLEKGISMLRIESQVIRGIKNYFSGIKFDLVLYATPPITFAKAIQFVKKRDGAKSYLLLKDIFPQNSVDLGMLSKKGVKGLIYKYFRRKEKKLYELSDKIGCMSQANVDYIIEHNPNISPEKVEICPNSVQPLDMRLGQEEKMRLREKYGLPKEKKIFIYGGNLGKPQGVPFLVECIKACADIQDAYFVVAGSGTDRQYLDKYVQAECPKHLKLFGKLPKAEYDKMVACCDVGLIFLDHRFTIPNFPSRLLSYMQAGLPVLACTDPNTDVGKVIEDGGFGWWCESDDAEGFYQKVTEIFDGELASKRTAAWEYLLANYQASDAYATIMRSIEK